MSQVWDYFTKGQQEKLTKRMEKFTPEQIKSMRKESNKLIAQLREAMEKGQPPESPQTVRLAKRLKEGSEAFNDPEIDKAIERFHVENPEKQTHGIDLHLYRYIEKAKAHS